MKTRRSTTVLAVITATLAITGCGGDSGGSRAGGTNEAAQNPQAASQPAPTDLVRDGELTVCTDASYPPLEYFGPNQEYVGFDVALATAVAKLWDVKPVFKNTTFSGILPAMASGRCDLAWSGLFVNEERVKQYAAVPYLKSASVLMVKKGNPEDIDGPESLAGKTVVSQNGSDLLKAAQQIKTDLAKQGKDVKVQGYDKFDEAVQQLVVGRADAVVDQDIDVTYRNTAQNGQFESVYTFPDEETFATYYLPDNADLGTKLAKALQALDAKGDLKRIAEEEGVPADGLAVGDPVGKGTSSPDGL